MVLDDNDAFATLTKAAAEKYPDKIAQISINDSVLARWKRFTSGVSVNEDDGEIIKGELRRMSQISLACTQNPLFVTSHGGLDMIFRDPTCPYGAVIVAVIVCVDVYYILYNIIKTAHTRMIHHHCDM